MSRLFLVSILFLSFFGCASSPATSNIKSLEFKALQENVTSFHANSIFRDDDPRLFDPKLIDAYAVEFAHSYCANGVSPQECGKHFNDFVFSKLSQRYFAADSMAVQKTCMNEPLICFDMNTLETLFRHLHNTEVKESERQKLSLLEDWRRGALTDEQLKSALHFDFKFEDGKLVMRL